MLSGFYKRPKRLSMKNYVLPAVVATLIAINANGQARGPHLLIYKTKKDYSKYVPVLMSADGTKIVSYPDPTDVRKKGKDMRATKLHKGYLMDNYGVGTNTAYVKITLTQYAAMKQAHTAGELYKKILVKNPMTTLYDCGPKANYNLPEADANKLIDSKQLSVKCKEIE